MYLRKKMYSGKRLARGQTHRRGSWRRVISVVLCAVLLSTNMVGVCAAEAQPPEDEKPPVCICDILCGDEGNSACPVCAEDPAQCAAAGTGGDVHHRLDVGGRRGVPYRI